MNSQFHIATLPRTVLSRSICMFAGRDLSISRPRTSCVLSVQISTSRSLLREQICCLLKYKTYQGDGRLFSTLVSKFEEFDLKNSSWKGLPFERTRNMCTIKKENRICWSCKKTIGDEIFFCEICKIIQPPLTELSFFAIFGSPERFELDVKALTNQYRQLQALIHPDKFSNSDEAEQRYSAEQSALINKAYITILDPLSRAVYLLGLKNIEIGESNSVNDTEFLMEIMEINEKLSEVKNKDELDIIRTSNNELIDQCIESLAREFRNGNLEVAKELTTKLRYYRNILEVIQEKTMDFGE